MYLVSSNTELERFMSLRYLLLDGGWAIMVDVHPSATGDTPTMHGAQRWILVCIPELFREKKLFKQWKGTWTRVESQRMSAQRSWNPHSHCLIWSFIHLFHSKLLPCRCNVQQSLYIFTPLSSSCHPGSTPVHLLNKYGACSPSWSGMEKGSLGFSRLMGRWRSVDTLGVIGQKPNSWKQWDTCEVLAASTHHKSGRMCSHVALKFYIRWKPWSSSAKAANSICKLFRSWEQSCMGLNDSPIYNLILKPLFWHIMLYDMHYIHSWFHVAMPGSVFSTRGSSDGPLCPVRNCLD